jgi:formate dehydrogenase iron-sulfur subunit
VNRRSFLAAMGATATTAITPLPARASTPAIDPGDTWGVLVDLTACIGCRTCESVCAEANGLPEPDSKEELVPGKRRETNDKRWTVVNAYSPVTGEVYAKSQCMHCVEPACAAACLTKALHKTKEGPVVWDPNKCMGCRYCMVSCPFDAPKFEYSSWNPKIQKCRMCYEQIASGKRKVPACVENCPGQALTYGKRSALLETARQRIYQNPGKYYPQIYGEKEAGGTSMLYIAPVAFERLGFRTDIGTESYPERTRDFLTAVPLVLVGFPAMLLAMRRATAPKTEGPPLPEQPPPETGDRKEA